MYACVAGRVGVGSGGGGWWQCVVNEDMCECVRACRGLFMLCAHVCEEDNFEW